MARRLPLLVPPRRRHGQGGHLPLAKLRRLGRVVVRVHRHNRPRRHHGQGARPPYRRNLLRHGLVVAHKPALLRPQQVVMRRRHSKQLRRHGPRKARLRRRVHQCRQCHRQASRRFMASRQQVSHPTVRRNLMDSRRVPIRSNNTASRRGHIPVRQLSRRKVALGQVLWVARRAPGYRRAGRRCAKLHRLHRRRHG